MEPKINKKRVLFVITQEEFGGAQRFLYELTIRLDKDRYEILVASGSKEKSGFLRSLEQRGIKTKKLKFLRREINPFFDLLAVIELATLIRKFKPDYLHLNSSKAGVLGSIAGFKKTKIIYRIGGWSFNDPWPWWKKKLFIAAEKTTAGFKDIIVVNNKKDYEQALKLKIKPRKGLRLIHNGIDTLKTEFLSKEEARRKLKASPIDFIIGTIANFYPTKGVEHLIKAVKTLKDNFGKEGFKLLAIGDGQMKKNLESLIRYFKLEKEVVLLGQIPEAQKYMKAFDVFVLPSVKEGFPWVILEAMAAKLPIVATSVGALPEMVEDGKSGILVEPKNPQKLAQAIKYLFENERVRQELGIQAHQTLLFKFPVEKMVRETEELFD